MSLELHWRQKSQCAKYEAHCQGVSKLKWISQFKTGSNYEFGLYLDQGFPIHPDLTHQRLLLSLFLATSIESANIVQELQCFMIVDTCICRWLCASRVSWLWLSVLNTRLLCVPLMEVSANTVQLTKFFRKTSFLGKWCLIKNT